MGRRPLLVAVVAFCWTIATAKVSLENNQYKGLVVAIDPSVPAHGLSEQDAIINSIKDLMNQASASVFEATDHRAYFSDVTILVPEDWSVTVDRNTSGRWESWKESNLRVVTAGRHNNAPLAVPGGGCGVQGTRLEVPLDYLTSADVQQRYGDSGVVMTATWLKYRYGVYEEHGFPGDPIYPHAYFDVEKNQTLPTGCTDHDALVGQWRNSKNVECDVMATGADPDPACRYAVEDTTVDYSLMFISHVEKVKHVCNSETHNSLAPTPQNRHCGGQSIWEVILQHDDFQGGKNPSDTSGPDTNPTFTVVQATSPALFLLIDDNCGRKPDGGVECYGKEVYDQLRETLRDILTSSNIPRLGIMKYFESFSALYKRDPLIPIGDINVDDCLGFIPSIPFEYNITDSESALVNALNKISESDYEGEVRLLFMQMVQTEEDGTLYPAALQDYITVTGILYGDSAFNTWMPTLTQQTNGKFLFNPDYNPAVVIDALIDLTPGLNEVTLLSTYESVDSEVVLDVYVDETVGIDTTFEVVFSEGGGKLVITDPDETEIPSGGTTVISDAKSGQWILTLTNSNNGTANVKVTSTPRSGVAEIEVITWTSASSLGKVDLNKEGLAFYVSVTQGNKAIKDLDVTVTFYAEDAGSESLQVKLQDDGFGDPDVQRFDGTYSGYVTDFGLQAGPQTEFFADVTIAPGASSLRQERSGHARRDVPNILPLDPFAEDPCCGSEAPGAINLPLNRCSTGATSVVVTNGPGDVPYDPPPSQIISVKVSNVDQEGPEILAGTVLVSLNWIAPGKDFTSGKVSDYEVWYSDSKSDIMAGYDSCNLVKDDEYEGGKPVPGDYGTIQTATVSLPKKVEETTQYFLVIVGLDADQKGSPSPLIGVTVEAGIPYTTEATTTQSSTSTETSTQGTVSTETSTQATGSTETSTQATGSTETSTQATGSTETSTQATGSTETSTHATGSTETSTQATGSTETSTQATGSTGTSTKVTGSTDTSTQYTTQFPGSSVSPETTDSPEDFVGSPGFWALIGVGILAVAICIIVATCIYCKKRTRTTPSYGQMLAPKNNDGKINNTSAYDSVRLSSGGEELAKTEDVENGLPKAAAPSESSGPTGVINKGLEDTEGAQGDSGSNIDDDDMITAF